MVNKKRLGDLLLDAGVIQQDALDKALAIQAGSDRRLGYLLIHMGFISEQELQAVLSSQLEIPLVDIHREFQQQARHLLPRYLCKKYNVLPLGLEDHNILNIAMIDPADHEAVRDIERYTGKVLQPRLASHSDIDAAIDHYIPWNIRDLFRRKNIGKLTAAAVLIMLVLLITAIVQYNRDRSETLYGTKHITSNAVFYQNHDLVLKFEQSGKISLQGHGAHARGSYSITFTTVDSLRQFIKNKRNDLSLAQQEWLNRILKEQTK